MTVRAAPGSSSARTAYERWHGRVTRAGSASRRARKAGYRSRTRVTPSALHCQQPRAGVAQVLWCADLPCGHDRAKSERCATPRGGPRLSRDGVPHACGTPPPRAARHGTAGRVRTTHSPALQRFRDFHHEGTVMGSYALPGPVGRRKIRGLLSALVVGGLGAVAAPVAPPPARAAENTLGGAAAQGGRCGALSGALAGYSRMPAGSGPAPCGGWREGRSWWCSPSCVSLCTDLDAAYRRRSERHCV